VWSCVDIKLGSSGLLVVGGRRLADRLSITVDMVAIAAARQLTAIKTGTNKSWIQCVGVLPC